MKKYLLFFIIISLAILIFYLFASKNDVSREQKSLANLNETLDNSKNQNKQESKKQEELNQSQKLISNLKRKRLQFLLPKTIMIASKIISFHQTRMLFYR